MLANNELLGELESQFQASVRRTAGQKKDSIGVETAKGVTRTKRLEAPTPTVSTKPDGQLDDSELNGHNGNNGSQNQPMNSSNKNETLGNTEQRQYQNADASLEDVLTLSQVADSIGVAQQHVVNLITRFNLISPQKSANFTPRETYVFTQEEAAQVRQVFELRDVRGKPIREAVEMVRNNPIYNKSARELQNALMTYGSDRESAADILDAILQSPRFTEEERQVLMLIEGHGKSILETGAELSMRSEREVITVLNSGYQKVGETLFDLLRIALDK